MLPEPGEMMIPLPNLLAATHKDTRTNAILTAVGEGYIVDETEPPEIVYHEGAPYAKYKVMKR